MRHITQKVIIVVCIINLMGVCGCSKTKDTISKEVAMGRYIEEDVKISGLNDTEYIRGILKTQDNKIQLYLCDDGFKVYEQEGSNGWERQEGEWINEFEKLCSGWVEYITNDARGNLYIAYTELNEANEVCTYIAKVENEQIEKIPIQWQDEMGYVKPTSMSVLENGNVLIADGGKIECYSLLDGRFIRNYEVETEEFIVIDKKIYQMNIEQSNIGVYAIDSGVLERTIPCEKIDATTQLVKGDLEDLYLIGTSGIQHLTKGGSLWEKIVDGSITSLGMPSYTCTQATVIEDEVFVAFYKKEGQLALKKYCYSKDTPTTPTIEIKAYMLSDNNALRQLATQYQLNNPNVKITLDIGLDGNGTLTKTDAIKALNTELLAGEGPDLILLDGLDSKTYIEKDILVDMSDWANEMLNDKAYLTNITNAYTVDDKLYAIPMHFMLPMVWGDEDVLAEVKSVEGLMHYKSAHQDEKLLSYKTPEQLICKFYTSCVPTWFDENGNMQEEKVVSFLEMIKVLANEGKPREKTVENTIEDFCKSETDIGDAIDVVCKDIAIQFIKPARIYDFLVGSAVNEQRGNGDFAPLFGQLQGVFEPTAVLGINTASDQKEIVEDIIRMAMSETIQDVDTEEGFPVNKVSFGNWIKGKNFDKNVTYSFRAEGEECKISVAWGYQEELQKFYEYCKTVKIPSVIDQTFLKIILEESQAYFEGAITVEEATARIEQKSNMYLKE